MRIAVAVDGDRTVGDSRLLCSVMSLASQALN
jgi:hypothetical protein